MATKTTTKSAGAQRPANQKHAEPASRETPRIDAPAMPPAKQNTETVSIGNLEMAPAVPPPAELSHTHNLIINAVSDLLTHGGHTKDVDGLIRSTMAHTERTWHGTPRRDSGEEDGRVADFISRKFGEWKADLVVAWRQNKRPERVGPDAAASISERLRFNARERVRQSFEEFMGGASSEELVVMLNLLEARDGRSMPAQSKQDEIYLASAMEDELTAFEQKYLKIPESMVDTVQKYVDALRALEGKAA